MIERLCWTVLVLIHASPIAAFFAPSMLGRLYGVDAASDVALLLQHRGALFALVVIACIWAAFDPSVAKLAVVISAVSMLSFLVLYVGAGMPAGLRTIAIADMVGLPFLAFLGWRAFFSG